MIKGTTKGESEAGDLVNGIWELGKPDANYTSQAVVETVAEGQTAPAFSPVLKKMVDPETGVAYLYKVIGTTTTYTDTFPAAGSKVAYVYDNQIVPQDKLPTLKAQLKNIGLEAKARRIAVFYSQIAAFQAKTDYGFDLAD